MENVKDLAFEDYKNGMKLKDIAFKYNIKESTVRSWKNRHWNDNVVDREVQRNAKNVAENDATLQGEKISKNNLKDIVDELAQNESLTEKQGFFCLSYIRNFNATQSAINAGYSPNTAGEIGYQLLQKTSIRAEINRLKKLKADSMFLSEEDIVERYMKIAFSDMNNYVDFFVEEVPVIKGNEIVMTKDPVTGEIVPLRKFVNTVRFKDSTMVDGGLISEISQGKDGARIKLEDRQKALTWLDKYFLINPMDKHKIAYDNKKLALKEHDTGSTGVDELAKLLKDLKSEKKGDMNA